MRIAAISRRPLDGPMSTMKRDRLRTRSSTHNDYWRFTYWSLKVDVLERRESRLMDSLLSLRARRVYCVDCQQYHLPI